VRPSNDRGKHKGQGKPGNLTFILKKSQNKVGGQMRGSSGKRGGVRKKLTNRPTLMRKIVDYFNRKTYTRGSERSLKREREDSP